MDHTTLCVITGHSLGLRTAIRSAMIPFPPVIIARSAACAVAEAYVSSNPAIGLFLVAPDPPDRAVSTATLPIAVMATPAEMDVLKRLSHVGKDGTVDLIETSELGDHAFLAKLEYWLDCLGV